MIENQEQYLYINSIIYPVTTLGPGTRIGLWVEGCTLNCPGCISPELFKQAKEHAFSIAEIIEIMRPLLPLCSGITISGGEPFQQAKALAKLISTLKEEYDPEIMIYTGHTLDEIYTLGEVSHLLLPLIDILVDGRFYENLSNQKLWRGSDNQRIYLLSKRAQVYGSLNEAIYPKKRTLQIEFSQNLGLRIIGIPEREFKKQIRENLRSRGIFVNS